MYVCVCLCVCVCVCVCVFYVCMYYTIRSSIIDCDKQEDIANKYNIESYPSIILLYKNKTYYYDASADKDNLITFLESSINKNNPVIYSKKLELSNIKLFELSNIKLFELSNIKLLELSNIKLLELSNIKLLELSNIKLLELSNIKLLTHFSPKFIK